MAWFTKLFGQKEPAPPPPPPERKPESPSPTPPPVLKQLPLDHKALERCGEPSRLHPPVKPARCIDEVPAGYDGDLYYRIMNSQRPGAAFRRYVRITPAKGVVQEDQPGQRLAAAWANHVARGRDLRVFSEPGKLRPDLTGSLPAQLLASAKKPFAEYVSSNWVVVSARFRCVLESLEPGAHLFLPLDTSQGANSPLLYIFFPGVAFSPTGLAIAANGIEDCILPNGGLSFGGSRLSASHFYFLNRNVIGSADVFVDSWLGPIVSKRALERLGDILPTEFAFMPMGVCEERLPPGAARHTRDGTAHQLA